jgi:polar amino acid transport system substrate-binding protein
MRSTPIFRRPVFENLVKWRETLQENKIVRRFTSWVVLATALAAAAEISVQTAFAQAPEDPRVADLVRAGELRVGLGLGVLMQAVRNPVTGELRGAALEMAQALAARIGVRLVTVEYPRPGAVIDGLRTKAWNVSFLVFDPARMEQVDFSHAFLRSDITCLVAHGSPIRSIADADQTGVRIAVPRGDGSDLYLSRTLKRAELVRTDSHGAAVNLLRTGGADAKASPRFVLVTELPAVAGSRVLDDGFADISYAAIVPKGQAARLAYVNEFIEDAKQSGLVKRIIESLGLQGVQVAPAEKSSVP